MESYPCPLGQEDPPLKRVNLLDAKGMATIFQPLPVGRPPLAVSEVFRSIREAAEWTRPSVLFDP